MYVSALVGAPYVPPPTPHPPPCPKPQEFSSGDRVRVQLDEEIFKMMQEGHGGWNDQMVEVCSFCPTFLWFPLVGWLISGVIWGTTYPIEFW